MDLNPATDDTPGPLTAAAARDPKPFGFALLAVGVVGLFAAIYFGYAAYTSGKPPADAPEGAEAVGGLVNRGFVVAALAGLGVALVGLGVGIATMARVPADDPRRRRTEARTLILTGGGLLGLVVMAAGAFYVVYTFGVLTDWLTDKTPPKQAWQPVAALLTVLVGAGLAFLAAQPARAEERNNPFLRRLVYGGNLALASLLLLLALVVGNVLVGLKVPNKLDTTEAGFYSLSDATKGYVADLQQPVTFAAVIPDGEDRSLSDIRRLLAAFQEVNPGQGEGAVLLAQLQQGHRHPAGQVPAGRAERPGGDRGHRAGRRQLQFRAGGRLLPGRGERRGVVPGRGQAHQGDGVPERVQDQAGGVRP